MMFGKWSLQNRCNREGIVTVAKSVFISTINDLPADFERLFSLWSQANDYFEVIRFDFSGCDFLRPNAVAFLGGLAQLIKSRLGTVVFD